MEIQRIRISLPTELLDKVCELTGGRNKGLSVLVGELLTQYLNDALGGQIKNDIKQQEK